MAIPTGQKEMIVLKELTRNWAYSAEALINLLERKGIIERDELIDEIRRLRSSGSDAPHGGSAAAADSPPRSGDVVAQ